MSQCLVVVESPAKCKTIKKYLGENFEVLASYGHIRDLPRKDGSVLIDDDFKITYQMIDRNKKHVDAIKKAAKKSDIIYLATDPDREGEAISWHVYEVLKEASLLKDKTVKRIAFNEITKTAVQKAIEDPREIGMQMVNSQQARVALDYLVGFNLSPLLWKKVRRGLSAGRVQSPALRLIVEKEKEIEKFIVEEYWTMNADLINEKLKFSSVLFKIDDKKVEKFEISNEVFATNLKQNIEKSAKSQLEVFSVEKKSKRRNPYAPFITSTLQQDAARKLGFSSKKTMMVAQKLYEGISLGGEAVGLITYMRTDSIHLSVDAVNDIREYILENHGSDNLPKSPRIFKSKSKNAQEAHEAIRVTLASQSPSVIRQYLSVDEFKLYNLIWKRTISCQMIHATLHTVVILLNTSDGKYQFKSVGSVIAKPGFLKIYQESTEDNPLGDKESDSILPVLLENDIVKINNIDAIQHFTAPPARYSEASLVKDLEEFGIGRPSTYASIITTLQQRDYVEMNEAKRFAPTDVGSVVSEFLSDYFEKYVDYNFTSNLEDELDKIATGKLDRVKVLTKFWTPFIKQIKNITASVKRSDVTQEKIDEKCPDCQSDLTIRLGKRGKFIGCSSFPDCNYIRSLDGSKEPEEVEIVKDRNCPKCTSDLVIKSGRYGKFIGCSNYPNCKHMEPLEKPKETDITCQKCKKHKIIEKKSRRGKVFYACGGYPKCKNAMWYPPIEQECPKCKSPILFKKSTKRHGEQLICPEDDCDFIENLGKKEDS